ARKPEWRYQRISEAINDLMNNRAPHFVIPDPLAITPPPAPVPSYSSPVASPPPPAYPPSPATTPRRAKPSMTLQNYRLDDQDLIILRWRMEQDERKKREAKEAQRDRTMPWIKRAAWVAVPCVIALWAFSWRYSYHYATVERVSGKVAIRENGT